MLNPRIQTGLMQLFAAAIRDYDPGGDRTPCGLVIAIVDAPVGSHVDPEIGTFIRVNTNPSFKPTLDDGTLVNPEHVVLSIALEDAEKMLETMSKMLPPDAEDVQVTKEAT